MEYINLKNTDLKVSRFCMGGCPMGGHGWGNVQEADLIEAVHTALDKGITFFIDLLFQPVDPGFFHEGNDPFQFVRFFQQFLFFQLKPGRKPFSCLIRNFALQGNPDIADDGNKNLLFSELHDRTAQQGLLYIADKDKVPFFE